MSYQMSLFDLLNNRQEFKIDKPIRLIELFAGYGSQHFALEYLGANFESWKICEWAVKSIQAYKDAHFPNDNTDYSKDLTREQVEQYLFNKGISADYNEPMTLSQIKKLGEEKVRTIYNNIIATHNLVSVVNCKAQDLEIVDRDKYDYVLTYSFPCFTSDSLVLTRNGYKKICDITCGDFVLSHDKKYHKVVNTFDNGVHDIYKINAIGVDEIKTTLNHKFYVREKFRKGHKGERNFKEPVWKELKDLTKNDYLGIAINQESKPLIDANLPTQNEHFWWIIGRYLGDGWIRNQQGIIICCDKSELGEITYHLNQLDWHYNITEEKTVLKIHIPKKALSDFVLQFGRGAGNKHLTQDVLDLPVHYLASFVEGYMSADGCFIKGVYKATSISRELVYGIAQCVGKVYKTPYRIYKVNPPKTKIIENRLVNQNAWYQLVFKTEKKKQDKAFYEDGYIWYPIKSIEHIGKNNVYDIEVEDSHSFTVQNTIVHNCQDLSKAGKLAGMSKGSGTRSGLLWEVERILDECNGNLPQVLLMENVPDVIGEKNKQDFAKWYQKLEDLGYANFYEVLNAKNFGVPQNRERCFMVSILGDHFYEFPTKFKLEKRLKDLLENNVSEKYYLSSKQISQIVNWNAYQDPLKNIDKEKIISPTLTTRSGAFAAGMILINEATKKGYAEAQDGDGVYINRPHQKRGVVQKGMIQTLKTSPDVGVVVNDAQDNRNMKEKLCDKLVESGIVKENDVVNHSYTNGLTGKNPRSRQKLEDFIETRDGIMPCMTTRPDTLGIVVKDVPLKRGYSVEINEESPDTTEIDIIGNYSKSNYNATPIVGKNGVALTVRENHGEVTAVAEESLFTDAQAQMFTEEGNVKRYINSDVVDEFNEGQCADISFPNGYNKGPRVHDECPAINTTTTSSSFVVKTNSMYNQLRIRKLTPKECFRLMGVKDEDYERIAANQSNASLYHLAGDSIVVDVLMYIFKQML